MRDSFSQRSTYLLFTIMTNYYYENNDYMNTMYETPEIDMMDYGDDTENNQLWDEYDEMTQY